jgi:LysR family hydrogen peroxide-inducible transcriptional activator
MTLTEFRYIVAVAEHRHFGKAAADCFVSQPTLSVAIRKLEEELGVRLFERNRSDVIVTPIGARIVAQAETVLQGVASLRQLAAADIDPLGKQVTLGVIYTIGPYLVPRLIGALKQRAPKLALVIKENFTDELVRQLRSGAIDAAIMSLPYSDPILTARALYDEPFVVVVPAEHKLAKRKRVAAAALADETLLLLGARNCFREQVIEFCPGCADLGRGAEGGLQKTLEGSSIDTICQMVATGVGVTVLPGTARLGEDLARHLASRPFSPPAPKRTVAVFYRRSFARPQVINCLVEAVREAQLEGVKYCN